MTGRGAIRTAGALAFLLTLPTAIRVAADGAIPALPYHYLQPPPALRQTNTPPAIGLRVLPRDYLTALSWGTFTTDAQAGLTAPKHALQLAHSAIAVTIGLRAVPASGTISPQAVLDGNAYQVSADEQPKGGVPRIVRPLRLTLRWPHIPVGMFVYQSNAWRPVCTQYTATVTPSTISCPIRAFGIYAAATIPSNTVISYPTTPASALNPYIPILLAGLLAIAVLIVGYLVSRPER